MTDPEMFTEKLFFKPHTKYAITLNPANGHQFFDKDNRLGKFYQHMAQVLYDIPGKYEFILEISEPYGKQQHTYDGPRLHIHGWFEFTKSELRQFMFYGYRSLCKYGRIEIGKMEPEWLDYMNKQSIIPKHFRKIVPKAVPSKKKPNVLAMYERRRRNSP